MKIALDAHGSDNAPFPEVEGSVISIKEDVCEKIFLVGDEATLSKELSKFSYPKERIEIVHASQIISMNDEAATAARTKQDSSIVKALQLHKEGRADAMLSVGNTGAVMAASLFTLGRMKNVLRPALALTFPTFESSEIVLDVGANVDCEPEYLDQFAVMGSIYSKFLFAKDRPRVALLNIGEESKKGNELTKKAYHLLEKNPAINFVGNIEGKDLLKGDVEVVICDGFVGNVMLKTVEGVASGIFAMMKSQMQKDWVAKLGMMLAFPVFKYIRSKLDHTEYGGVLLVGLNGIAVVGHGRSNAIAIKNAVKFTNSVAESQLLAEFQKYFEGICL